MRMFWRGVIFIDDSISLNFKICQTRKTIKDAGFVLSHFDQIDYIFVV